MMELNAKSPFLWDWENLFMFSSKTVEAPKKLQLVDSRLDAMEGFEAASIFSSGGRSEVGSGGSASASDFGYGSSSKSSKSVSVDSSTNKVLRESLLKLVANDCSLEDPNCKSKVANAWQSKTSSTTESPVHSGESLIGLMLGKRTYFEDVSVGNNGKTAASIPFPSDNATEKRSKLCSLKTESFHCQVEGCGLDLSLAKDYHRKHRVCEAHSKSPVVIVSGLERRFCQQCSRFHSLSEFDQKKRSCRRRLSDHNSRRRKPKPEIIPFNSMRLPSSLYDGRQQIAFDQVPIVQPRANASPGWDFTAATDVPQARLSLFSSTKAGGNNDLHLTSNEPQHPGGARQFNHPTQVAPSKGVLSDVFPEGLRVSTIPLNLDATRNLRALSLLSNTLGSSEPAAAAALNQPTLSSHPSRASQQPLQRSGIHPVSLGLPPASSGYWQGDQQTAAPSGLNVSTSRNTHAYNSHFQEFQLFKGPSDPNFYMY